MNWNDWDISEDAKLMLNELLQRKQKLDKLKSESAMFHMAAFAAFAFFAFVFYDRIWRHVGGQVLEMLKLVNENVIVLVLALFFIACFAAARILSGKAEEQKQKYEALRLEAIDKFKSDWQKNIKSEARDAISKQMLEKFDVNLIYKN